MITNNLDPGVHRGLDVAAGAGIVGTLVGALPAVAALIGIIYYCILVYESKTVQGWLDRRRRARKQLKKH